MVKVKKIVCGDLKQNCYVVYNNCDAVIIDPGDNLNEILAFVTLNQLKVGGILLTHGHYDHICSCKELQDMGYSVYIHELDADKCENNDLNLSNQFSCAIKIFKPDKLLTGGSGKLNFSSICVNYIHTPGHSQGGVSYLIDNFLFSGDTLFDSGYGRYDFYDGSFQNLRQSLKTLTKLVNDGFKLFAGH